jgi:hypothetical protein
MYCCNELCGSFPDHQKETPTTEKQNLNPELSYDRSESGKPRRVSFIFDIEEGFSYLRGEEDWYLASGGMCQRNRYRIRTLEGTVDFVARQLLTNCTTVPRDIEVLQPNQNEYLWLQREHRAGTDRAKSQP